MHKDTPPPSSLPYTAGNIVFVPLSPVGGRGFFDKLSVLWKLPGTIRKIRSVLKKVDAFQLRTPTGIGVYLIPWFFLFVKKQGWYKYAGNWNQLNAPLGYALQRGMLKKQSRKVTINGRWADQPVHCYTFENPCLHLNEREEGRHIIDGKQYVSAFSFCFVGRLDDDKGVQRIIDAFKKVKKVDKIKMIHFVGDGPKHAEYQKQADELKLPMKFHGFLKREAVFELYRESHFLLLPSTASEGFPKVIAEGMNFGCIPIVSGVSSIGQYINSSNGYIVDPVTSEGLKAVLDVLISEEAERLKLKAITGYDVAENFTFQHYSDRIFNEILAS